MAVRSALINVMAGAALKAARGLIRDFGEVEQLQVSIKGPGEFVSSADLKAEKTLKAELAKARPGYGFLMEESGTTSGSDAHHRWIIDPLDGTTNFLHGIPHFAISIGLERDGVAIAGLVYNPAVEEMFIAERGKGAFLNEQRIRVAARTRLAEAVIACGLPHLGHGDLALGRKEAGAMQAEVAGLRRFGAAALDLAWVAAGRIDAYWERDIKPWDMAAGMVLVREAGGFVSDCNGGDDMYAKGHIASGNDSMHKAVLAVLKAAAKT